MLIFDLWILANYHPPEQIVALLMAVPVILIGVLVDGVRSAARRDTWQGVRVNCIISVLLIIVAIALALGWSMIKVDFDDERLRVYFRS
jgi:hypothetical protein